MTKVKMINSLFGNAMWVAEDRVEEYKAAGHKLAASATKPAKEEKPVSEELKDELKEAKKRNKRK